MSNERLAQELRSRADQAGGHPISLDDVKRSATKMRWQQRAAAAGVAAVVLAVAVPVGIAVTNGNATNGKPPVATNSPTVATPSPTPTATPKETPAKGKTVQLTANIEGMGGEPSRPYWLDGAINNYGNLVETPVPMQSISEFGDGWVGLGIAEDGNPYVYFMGAEGSVTDRVQSGAYTFAVSPDRSQVSYASADGKLFVRSTDRSTDAADTVELPTGGASSVVPVAFDTAAGPNTVLFTADGDTEQSRAMVASSKGAADVEDYRAVLDHVLGFDGDLYAVLESVSDDGSCSAVIDAEGSTRWETCEYTLGRFSPDAKYVIGRPAYLDGLGDTTVAVLDAATGKLVVEYEVVEGAHVNNTVWETNDTLLTSLYDDGWAIMRLGVDGAVTKASSGRIAGAPEECPVFFEAQP
jgi:hypothetical protein